MKPIALKYTETHTWEETDELNDPQVRWVHFDGTNKDTQKILDKTYSLNRLVVNAMLDPTVRPRYQKIGDGELLILRTANIADPSDAEDLPSIRIWITPDRVYSIVRRETNMAKGLRDNLLKQPQANCSATIVLGLIKEMIPSIETLSSGLQDQIDAYEDQVLAPGADPMIEDVSFLSRQAVFLRRHLSPVLQALLALASDAEEWLQPYDRDRVREIAQKFKLHIEDIDLLKERSYLVRSYIESHIAEQVNRRLYIFSVVAVIFLPLSFVTGLFGINVGGIPGSEYAGAFLLFCGGLVGCTLAMVGVMKWTKWI